MSLLDTLSGFFTALTGDISGSSGLSDILGDYMNKPKKFKPANYGYADTSIVSGDQTLYKALIDMTTRISDGRRNTPFDYYDNVVYPHRLLDKRYHLRIGDCLMLIPPEYIQVSDRSKTEQIVALRQKSTLKTKYGYNEREIVISLNFNGANQINGFPVSSPFDDIPYYMDGLIQLICQFKIAPFLPIENELINGKYDIFNVALKSLNVNTVEGFPQLFQVILVMEEFNAEPYLEVPNCFLDNMFDWDLFRYHYQKVAKEIFGKINPVDLNNKFTISLLSQSVLDGTDTGKTVDVDFSDSKNYIAYLSEKDDVTIKEISFNISNILPVIQLSDQASPTMQYLGGLDTTFNIVLQTTNSNVISIIEKLNRDCLELARDYRDRHGLGFVKFDNDICRLAGVDSLTVDEVKSSTVPGFPGLFTINLQCISYDLTQYKVEQITGYRPFDGTDYKDQTINQTQYGIKTKIKQDTYVENKMMDMELYPDLMLPTYDEIDIAIGKINSYRVNNNLKPLPFQEYPRDKTYQYANMIKYEKFLDPDFYVFYPYKYADIDDSLYTAFPKIATPKACSYTVPEHEFGEDTDILNDLNADGTIDYDKMFSAGGSPTSDTGGGGGTYGMSGSIGQFLQLVSSKVDGKCGYSWGASGETMNQTTYNALPHNNCSAQSLSLWNGKQVFDCSGLVFWALTQLKVFSGTRGNDRTLAGMCTLISESQIQPGDLCFIPGVHVAVYIGNGKTAEAASTAKGCIYGSEKGRFQQWGRLKCLSGSKSAAGVTVTAAPSGGSSSASPTKMPDPTTGDWPNVNRFDASFISAGSANGIDPCVLKAICMQESSGSNFAEDKYTSLGPMQVRKTGGFFTDLKAKGLTTYSADQLSDNNINIQVAAQGLKYLYLSHNCTNISQAVSWYNGGGNNTTYIAEINKWYSQLTGRVMNSTLGASSLSSLGGGDTPYNYATLPNAGQTFSQTLIDFSTMCKEFGLPLFSQSPLDSDDNFDTFDNNTKDGKYLNYSCVDMVKYNRKNRLVRAYPSYVFMILDDNDTWYQSKKLWTNYYTYNSIIHISVTSEDSQPVHTALVKISNVYENLSKAPRTFDFYENLNDDPEIGTFRKWIFNNFGTLLMEPEITDRMLELKSTIYSNFNIDTGCKIHIRLGYGSNPLDYPIAFNGIITDLQIGDVIILTAQSEGLELINEPISSDQKETNSITKLQSEPSDIIASLLCDRTDWLLNDLSGGNICEKSKYGIEHYGIWINKKVETAEHQAQIDTVKKGQNFLEGIPIVGFIADAGAVTGSALKSVWRGTVGNVTGTNPHANHNQYDICKNLYIGSYTSSQFCSDKGLSGWLDGESNVNMHLYNRTPWDLMQFSTQTLPEFVCQTIYHQFESRVFFGLPIWLCKYRYEIDNNDNTYEYAKSFAQMHYIDSYADIIDNQVTTSSKTLKTNCIATYSSYGKLNSTPTLYADRSIEWTKQKTMIIDTTVVQDYVGPDWIYEKTFWPVAKTAAINMGVSNIIDSLEHNYQGSMFILGDASIKPCDYLYINDMFAKLSGLSKVKSATHTLSADTGFISDITPGVIVGSTKNDAGLANMCKSMLFFGTSVAMTNTIRKLGMKSIDKVADVLGKERIASIGNSAFDATKSAMSLAKDGFKSCKILNSTSKTIPNIITSADSAISASTDIAATTEIASVGVEAGIESTVADGAATAGTVIGPLGTFAGYAIGFIVSTIICNVVLGAVFDEFQYNNTVYILPLMYRSKYFISGVNGQQKLILGYSDNGNSYESDTQ